MITRSLDKVSKLSDPAGVNSKGKEFKDLKQALGTEIVDIHTHDKWYKGSVDYWDNQPTTNEGVLGGYGAIHDPDIVCSNKLFEDFKFHISGWNSAIDMGAGIGRISKELLLPRFKNVDLLEPAKVQIAEAQTQLGGQIRKFYNCGLQDFKFEQKYDCIWIQWVFMYMTDKDMYLKQNTVRFVGNKQRLILGFIVRSESQNLETSYVFFFI